ncbi:SRPBCC family protein [Flavobacterium rhizosphaerae]|uniref:SRPBCC family protein n=1 Tax=Flavobacterium rhizosphaerae TaxID=3163298 RepID=A0ABW8Z108_9FLAO
MPRINLHTSINAPADIVFDLSRSIDLHKISTARTNEEAIAGRTSGLIEMGEEVTWRARHLGITQLLTSKITAFNAPVFFADEMVSGAFKSFRHEHLFKEEEGITVMTDIFEYKSPLGIFGRLADVLFLKRYMYNFLAQRNAIIKSFAENPDSYKKVLPF